MPRVDPEKCSSQETLVPHGFGTQGRKRKVNPCITKKFVRVGNIVAFSCRLCALMQTALLTLLPSFWFRLRTRVALQAETLALSHQIIVLQKSNRGVFI